MQKPFGTGLYQSNDDLHLLVFAECIAYADETRHEVVIYTEALHPIEKKVMGRGVFEERFHKADRVVVEQAK